MPQPARMLTAGGETWPIEEWATLRGLAVEPIRSRFNRLRERLLLRRGVMIEQRRILATPALSAF